PELMAQQIGGDDIAAQLTFEQYGMNAARLVELALLFKLPGPVENQLEDIAHGKGYAKNQARGDPEAYSGEVLSGLRQDYVFGRDYVFNGGHPSGCVAPGFYPSAFAALTSRSSLRWLSMDNG